jgi:hypothetical protein
LKNKIYGQGIILLCVLLFLGTSIGVGIRTAETQNEKGNHQGMYVFSQTINPSDDAAIGNIYDTNMGDTQYVGLRNGGQGDAWVVSAALKFDLSSIPADAIIKSATVNLYYYRNIDSDAYGRALNMYRFLSDWNEETITRATMPLASSELSSVTNAPPSTGVWVSWDVTEDIQKFLSGTLQNYGWIINDEGYWPYANIPYMQLRSKEYGSNIPFLDVQLLELKPTFLFGRITNLTDHGNFVTFSGVKLHCLQMSPFSYNTYQSGETLAVSSQKIGILNTNFAFGKFNAAMY